MVLLFNMKGKKTKKTVQNKILKLKKMGKTDREVLAVVPSTSQSFVTKLVKEHRDEIQASKKKYIRLLDKTIGDIKQVAVLKNCLDAKADIYNFKGDIVGSRDDYKIQLETVKYLDKIKGREVQALKQTQNNTFISKDLDRYIK